MDIQSANQSEMIFQALKHLTFSAHYLAKKAHDEVIKSENHPERHETAATAFVNQASAYMSAAYALYHTNYDALARNDIDDVFESFRKFSEELLQSFAENHSYQHTHIYFDEFMSDFKSSVLSNPI